MRESKAYQTGKMFAPKVEIEAYERNGYHACISMEDYYYETDLHKTVEESKDEIKGVLESIRGQIDKILNEL